MPPCVYGEPVIDYFNRKDVKAALHIPDDIQAWDMCADSKKVIYTILPAGSQWVYEKHKGKYRMLKFSGDTDGAVPTTGTLGWIHAMNWKVEEAWRPYNISDGKILAGYIETYEGNLTFASVHGAGHMAPQFKPA